MDKHLKDCLPVFNKQAHQAVHDGLVTGRPFVEYANDAAHLFAGFQVVMEILEVNNLMESNTDSEDAAKALSKYESGALIAMIRAMSGTMVREADRLAAWTAKQAKPGRVQK